MASYFTRFIQITLSSDQTISSDSATLVEFDSISGDANYKMSLNGSTTGRLDFKADSQYYVVGTTALQKDNSISPISARWYNTSGVEQSYSSGAFRSHPTYTNSSNVRYESMNCQLVISPSQDVSYDLKIEGETGTLKQDGTFLFIIEMSKS